MIVSSQDARRVVVATVEFSLRQWQQWCQAWQQAAQRGTTPTRRTGWVEEFTSSAYAEEVGDWVPRGAPRFPAEPDPTEVLDGLAWVPGTAVEVAASMLGSGTGTGFCAQSYGADPFDPDQFGWLAGGFDEVGPGQAYASRVLDYPQVLDAQAVELKLARLTGFTAAEEAEVHRLWPGYHTEDRR